MLLPALLVVFCSGSIQGDRSHTAQYRQHLDYNYYKHYQHLHHPQLHQQNNRRLQRTESSSHLSSPAYRYQPRPGRHQRQLQYKYDRKPILIQPSQPSRQKVLRRPLAVPGSDRRTTRKIQQTPLLLRKEAGGRGKYSSHQGQKYKNQFLIKNDNLAVESKILETKVKVPQFATSAHKAKPQSVKSRQNSVKPAVPVNRNYNQNVPQRPKFIIKQAGKI